MSKPTLEGLHPLVRAVINRANEQMAQWNLLSADEQAQAAGMQGSKVSEWLGATASTEDAARRLVAAMEEESDAEHLG